MMMASVMSLTGQTLSSQIEVNTGKNITSRNLNEGDSSRNLTTEYRAIKEICEKVTVMKLRHEQE